MHFLSVLAFVVAASAPALGQEPTPLAQPGEVLPGAIVDHVETHPEYQRVWLRYPNGALVPAEVTTPTEGNEGLCSSPSGAGDLAAGGAVLYPREDLGTGPRPADTVGPMLALCSRLSVQRPTFRARGATGDTREGTEPQDEAATPRGRSTLGTDLVIRVGTAVSVGVSLLYAWRSRRKRPVGLS